MPLASPLLFLIEKSVVQRCSRRVFKLRGEKNDLSSGKVVIGIFVTDLISCFYFSWIGTSINYSSCSVTKRSRVPQEKLELIIDVRDFINYLFVSWFSVSRRPEDEWRFSKHQIRKMKVCKLLFATFLSFPPFQAVLSNTSTLRQLTTFFLCVRTR